MKKDNKNIVFYGGGHMSESIIRGLLTNEVVTPKQITVQEMISQRCEYLRETYNINALQDATEEIKAARMVLVGVNPPQVPIVNRALQPILDNDTILLSFACGVEIKLFEEQLGAKQKVARLVPNTLSRSGNGYSCIHLNDNLDEDDRMFVEEIVGGLGKILYLAEENFNDFQAYGCTGPLWIYKFAEAMIDAGIYVGFNRVQARELIIENMLGVAKELQISGASPTAKIEELTSPGGVTIEALRSLQENGSYMTPTIASMVAALKKCSTVAGKTL